MKLQDLVNQRFQNTVYVYPEAGEKFIPRNTIYYEKAKQIVEILFDLYFRFSLKLLEELFGFSFLLFRNLGDNKIDEIKSVEELEPIFANLFVNMDQLIDLINNDQELFRIQNIPIEEFKQIATHQVNSFSHKILERLKELQEQRYIPTHRNVFIDTEFNKYYLLFEDYLYCEFQYYRFFIEFQNLDLEKKNDIQLDERFKIKVLNSSDYHIVLYRRKNIVDFHDSIGTIQNPVLEINLKCHKDKGYDLNNDCEGRKGLFRHSNETLGKNIYDILSVLRLYKSRYVGFRRIFLISPGADANCQEFFMPYLYSLPFINNNQSKYIINKSDEDELINVFTKYKNSKNDIELTRAIRRYNFAYERRESEDRLIDFFIALETLFNIEGQRGKNIQLAKGIAELIGKNNVEKRILRKQINKCYQCRDDIMHKEKKQVAITPQNASEYMEDITRKVILKKLLIKFA